MGVNAEFQHLKNMFYNLTITNFSNLLIIRKSVLITVLGFNVTL